MTRWPPAPDLPFLVYSFPVAAPAIAGGPQAIELCGLKNVIGLKFTAHGFYKLSLIRNTGADVINGYDEVLAVQARVNELIEFTIRYAYFQGVKTLLRWNGIDCGQRVEPRRRLTDAEQQGLREALLASPFAYLAG
ncbi:MAG: hypothetical protein C0504_08875 [Candidatus Solibacter sp.]|nr:hypothetical protein [Candidatus Solibacter sp.]